MILTQSESKRKELGFENRNEKETLLHVCGGQHGGQMSMSKIEMRKKICCTSVVVNMVVKCQAGESDSEDGGSGGITWNGEKNSRRENETRNENWRN